jgi:hypothetical protein
MQPETIVTASKLLERAAEAGVFLSYSRRGYISNLLSIVFLKSSNARSSPIKLG